LSWAVRSALPEEATVAGIRSTMRDLDPARTLREE